MGKSDAEASTKKQQPTDRKKRSLAELVISSDCFLCSIPERATIEEARANGVPAGNGRRLPLKHRDLIRWLIEDCGYPEERVMRAKAQISRHLDRHARLVSE